MNSLLLRLTCLLALSSPLLFLGCGGDGDSGQLPDDVAAKVGSTTISEADVTRQLDVVYATQGGSAKSFGPPNYTTCAAKYRSLPPAPGRPSGADTAKRDIRKQCKVEFKIQRVQALATLVRAEWLARESKWQRLPGIEQAVRESIDAQRQTAAGVGQTYDKTLQKAGLTEEAAVEVARADVRQQVLLDAIPVSNRDIRRYGTKNFDVYGTSARRQVEIVQTKKRTQAAQARRDLAGGSSWRQVRARYAIDDPTTWTGWQTIKQTAAPADEVGKAMFSSKVGQLGGPVRNFNGWFVFRVESAKPGSKRFSSQARANIRSTLRATRLEQHMNAHFASDTRCAPRYSVPEAAPCYAAESARAAAAAR